MIKSIDFYFRISEQANMAHDESGNPCECYMKLGFNLKKPISRSKLDGERKKSEKEAIATASKLLKKDETLLSLISEKEYLDNTDED